MDKEQPEDIVSSPVSVESVDCLAEDENSYGSLNKFKDKKSLEEAYINLQSEFTRKCQKLSELEKQNMSVLKNDNLETPNVSKPFYEDSSWHNSVEKFLEQNPKASAYAVDIANMLFKDKELANSPNSLEIAFNKIIASKFKTEDELMNDENFVNSYVLNNEKIKNTIIKNYINKIKNNISPQVINTSKFSGLGLAPNYKPKTLDEAKKLASDMFLN